MKIMLHVSFEEIRHSLYNRCNDESVTGSLKCLALPSHTLLRSQFLNRRSYDPGHVP